MNVIKKKNEAEDVLIAESIVELLAKKGLKLSAAESCTGGLLAKLITDVPGSSAVINESYITYSNEAKSRILGVSEDTISKYGAVSAQTAYEMAYGIAEKTNADIGVGITGVAGPDSSESKSVGLVYFAISYGGDISVYELNLKGSRNQIRLQTCINVFDEIKNMLNN